MESRKERHAPGAKRKGRSGGMRKMRRIGGIGVCALLLIFGLGSLLRHPWPQQLAALTGALGRSTQMSHSTAGQADPNGAADGGAKTSGGAMDSGGASADEGGKPGSGTGQGVVEIGAAGGGKAQTSGTAAGSARSSGAQRSAGAAGQASASGGDTKPVMARTSATATARTSANQAAALESAYFANAKDAQAVMHEAWTLMPASVGPGDVVLVRHDGPGSVVWAGNTYKLQPFGTGYYTYVPIDIRTKPGKYSLGGATLTVETRHFPEDRIQVSQQLESIRQNTARIAADQKLIDAARSHSAPKFLFPPDSTFLQPVEGRISTPFGYTRYVNGKYDGSHTAIDIAAPQGTPVRATNDGVVVMAQMLYLTGNSVYIDHGMDLYSQYIHMSKLLVKPGDKVKKGQIIGLVGQTGFATGPHTHFTFWAHNHPVNPNPFFNSTPFHWLSSFNDGA